MNGEYVLIPLSRGCANKFFFAMNINKKRIYQNGFSSPKEAYMAKIEKMKDLLGYLPRIDMEI